MSQANYPTTSPQGCFSNSGNLAFSDRILYDSSAACISQCLKSNSAVAAMTEQFDCWCGSEFPPQSAEVDSSRCSSTCPAYPAQFCGGQGYWTVWSTGLLENPSFASGGSDSSSATPSSHSQSSTPQISTATVPVTSVSTSVPEPQTVTLDGSTIVETLVPTASPPPSSSGSSTGAKVGVAVGVVVGLLALAVIVAGVYFFLRRRRQNRDGHHRRNSSLNGFINADRNPPAYAMNDTRLDPTMVERRQSDGSIFADNQDYSRRILKVTNPDGS